MQRAMSTSTTSARPAAFGTHRCSKPSRVVLAQAKRDTTIVDNAKRAAAAVGAVLLVASPFAGPAIARPSDFIQSKPSSTPGEPTNKDKFPYNPSTTGNKAGKDTEQQVNTNENPQSFSNNKGLGKALTGSEANEPIPSPTEMGADPQRVGAEPIK